MEKMQENMCFTPHYIITIKEHIFYSHGRSSSFAYSSGSFTLGNTHLLELNVVVLR